MFTNDGVEATYVNLVQYDGKLENGNLNSTLLRRATKVKSDSTLTVINKLRIFCHQYELAEEVS